MQQLVSDRLAFLKQLEEAKKPKLNKGTAKYINCWIQRNYSDFVDAICWNFNVVRKGGESAFDYLNNCILNMYNDASLSFSNQSECDLYMAKQLNYRRFIIPIRITNNQSE